MEPGLRYSLANTCYGCAILDGDGKEASPPSPSSTLRLFGLPLELRRRLGIDSNPVDITLVRDDGRYLRAELPNGRLPLLEFLAGESVEVMLVPA